MSEQIIDIKRVLVDKEYFLAIQSKIKSGQLNPDLGGEKERVAYGKAGVKFCDNDLHNLADASFKGENYYEEPPSPRKVFWNILGRRLGF